MFIAWLDRTLFRAVSVATQILLVSAAAAAFYQVLSRFVLQAPADWSEAWTRASLIWTVFLGGALAFRQGAMLCVEMLRNLLHGRAQRWLETTIALVCVVFLGVLVWVGASMVWRVRFQTMPSFDVSVSWVYLAIPVGAGLAIVGVIARWWEGSEPARAEDVTAL